ncbi:MAG: hypothetical protein E7426_05335 [Ruminococcaceae bacterium]|jgi:hypothetical protein|nr:hypothetical protein [Oscillospiraceae bacterium]
MSASREKKLRQQLAASGTPDPKKTREEEERRQQHRSNWLYGGIAAAFVLVAALLLLWNSNVIQRSTTALTVDGAGYSAAEVDYYYYNLRTSWLSSSYASYLSLSTATDLKTAQMTDLDKTLTGAEGDDITWDAFLKQMAIRSITAVEKAKALAIAENYVFTDAMQQTLDENLKGLQESAKSAGYSAGAYLKALFGNNMTMSTFKSLLHDNILASQYQQDYADSLTFSDSDLENYYGEHQNDLDVVDYEYIYFSGIAPATQDADGNTVQPTDEESAAAKEAASKAANEALERYNAGESLKDIAEDYDIASYTEVPAGTYSSTAIGVWAFDSSRQANDAAVVDSDPSSYVGVFHSRSRNDYATVDVRHILFLADTSELDTSSETYETDSKAIWKVAESKANDALQQWKDGEATEDSFAALANELSEDPGSNTTGGLYEKVTKGEMVTAFNDWIFDENRQAGDTGIVETTLGYHVMYFSGENMAYWQRLAEDALRTESYNQWLEDLISSAEVVEKSGMKYVG